MPGLDHAQPCSIVELGQVNLFATPVIRVFVSIFFFLIEWRYSFVLITAAVLMLLLFSMFVVGPLVSA